MRKIVTLYRILKIDRSPKISWKSRGKKPNIWVIFLTSSVISFIFLSVWSLNTSSHDKNFVTFSRERKVFALAWIMKIYFVWMTVYNSSFSFTLLGLSGKFWGLPVNLVIPSSSFLHIGIVRFRWILHIFWFYTFQLLILFFYQTLIVLGNVGTSPIGPWPLAPHFSILVPGQSAL